MKKSRLLVLPLILALAACNKPAEYNVKAELPSGGEEARHETDEEKTAYDGLFADFQAALGAGFASDAIAINLKADAKISDVYIGEGVTGSGNISADFGLSVALPTETREYSAVKIEVKDLTFSLKNIPSGVDEEEKPLYKNYDAKGLKLNFVYQIVEGSEEVPAAAYAFLDISDKNVYNFLKPLYEEYAQKAADELMPTPLTARALGDEPTDPTGATLPDFDTVYGKGKFSLNVTAIYEIIKAYMASKDDSGDVDPTPRALLGDPAPVEEEEEVNPDVLGDYLGMGVSMLSNLLPFGLSTVFRMLYASGTRAPTLKSYKDDAGKVSRIGVADTFDYEDIKNIAPQTYKMATPTSGEGEGEEEVDPVKKLRAGFAVVVGNTHGTKDLALESVEVKADVAVDKVVSVQASAGLNFLYGEQAAFELLTATEIADYTDYTIALEIILPIILPLIDGMMESHQPNIILG